LARSRTSQFLAVFAKNQHHASQHQQHLITGITTLVHVFAGRVTREATDFWQTLHVGMVKA